MKPRQKKSRRRSGASSTAEQRLKTVVFYVDESLHSKILIREMRAVGATVRHAGEAFPFGAPDEVWLDGCGKNGWVVLTRDQRIRFRLLERMALEAAGVAAFVFTGGEATGRETAETIRPMLRKMANMAISEPKPFLYTFGLSGSLTRARVRRKKTQQKSN